MIYLSNGSAAWEIPCEIAFMYRKGLYGPPAGWFILRKVSKKCRQGPGGQWQPPAGEIFVDDHRVQAAADNILRKSRGKILVRVKRGKHE
jgi:hypothetical protein